MSTLEMAMYETFGILPASRRHSACTSIGEFIGTISEAIRDAFPRESLPELVVEPGRSIAGPNQHLLLTVQAVKHRPGVRTWVITDGGVSTVSLPTYYERHQVLLANDLRRRIARRVTLTGAACFAGDIVYKNILMPDLRTGDILAVMDSGAYFTALESSFGFPRPAIVAVEGSEVRLLRRRETYPEMVSRDIVDCTGGGHEFLHRSPHP
jgi:diaminopimelate decarboxylase